MDLEPVLPLSPSQKVSADGGGARWKELLPLISVLSASQHVKHSPGLSTCSGPGISSVWAQVPAPG